MSNILLTGGTGFIGSHTAVELLNEGERVILLDDLSNSDERIVDRIEGITGKRAAFYRGNAADKTAVEHVFEEESIDAVIHFAGFKAVGESVCKPLEYYRNNLDSTLTLLEVMREHRVNRFIFSSSATVYNMGGSAPFTEDMPVGGCANPYGWTKYMIEQILRDTAAADSQLSVLLLRYFNPIGAHESGLIGEKPNGVPNNLMPYITQVAAGLLPRLSVFGGDYPTPDGTGVRDYVHVVDLAKGHIAALRYAMNHTGTETVNLGTGRGYSVLELVRTFEAVNNVKIPYRIEPRRAGDLAVSYAGTEKAELLLGWRAEKDLSDMCRDAWRWQQNSIR